MQPSWTTIDGWFTLDEGQALQDLARGCVVLEIGSYKGRSTLCLTEVARLVVSVDHHRGDQFAGYDDTSSIFMRNTKDAHNLIPIFCSSHHPSLITLLESTPFEGVLIDGNHTHDAILRDTILSLHLLPLGGWIAWHDWNQDGPWGTSVKKSVQTLGLPVDDFPISGDLAWTFLTPEMKGEW